MKVFEVRDVRIPSLLVLAPNLQVASHIFLRSIYDGLGHFPKALYTIGEHDGFEDDHPVMKWVKEDRAGIPHITIEGGWGLEPFDEGGEF